MHGFLGSPFTFNSYWAPEHPSLGPRDPPQPSLLFCIRQEPGPCNEPAVELVVFESEAALRALAKITRECNALGDKSVHLFMDETNRTVYAHSKKEDMQLKPGFFLGSVGGGSVLDRKEDELNAVPFELLEGDRTWAQLEVAKEEGPDEDEQLGGKTARFKFGTIYSLCRDLEAKQACPRGLSMTSYGNLQPRDGDDAKRGYAFSTPPGSESHRPLDFVLTTTAAVKNKISGHNFWDKMVRRSSGVGQGVAKVIWRFSNDAGCLRPTRPHVVLSAPLKLEAGKPKKIAWHDTAKSAGFVGAWEA